jgi:hypothetical protein
VVCGSFTLYRDLHSSATINCQTYIQHVVITNSLKATVEATIRPGSSDRYSVCPNEIQLKAGESISVEVKLRVTRFAHKQRAFEGQRDVFHIKTAYCDQKFSSTFYLSPSFDDVARAKEDRHVAPSSPFKQAQSSVQAAKHLSTLSISAPNLASSAIRGMAVCVSRGQELHWDADGSPDNLLSRGAFRGPWARVSKECLVLGASQASYC